MIFAGVGFEELREQMGGALDWPSDQLRKEGDVERKVAQMFFRGTATAVDINGIAEGLEGIEGDTDGEEEFDIAEPTLDPHLRRNSLCRFDEEVEVFEDKKHAKVHDQADAEEQPSASRRLDAPEGECHEVVHKSGDPNQCQIFHFPTAIKEVTGQKKPGPTKTERKQEQNHNHQRKEECEMDRVKEHRNPPLKNILLVSR